MNKTLDFTGRITNGKLPQPVAKSIAAALLCFEGQNVAVSVKEIKRPRSLGQLRYLFGFVYPPIVGLFREQGTMATVEEVHHYCKLHVSKLRKAMITPDDVVKYVVPSISELPASELSKHIEATIAHFTQFGCAFPMPGEVC